MLLSYSKENGDMRVPRNAPAPWTELGVWVNRIRTLKRSGRLKQERESQLDGIGFDWRVDGETLENTEGLLNEKQFRKESGLTRLTKYRKQGLIEPVGLAVSVSNAGLSAFDSSGDDSLRLPDLRVSAGIPGDLFDQGTTPADPSARQAAHGEVVGGPGVAL